MILSKNRIFSRKEPSDTAKLFIIFCEGARREFDYFMYFAEIDSRLNIEIVSPEDGDDNSPVGLVDKAKSILFPKDGSRAKYQLTDDDEIWFVVDTDKWGNKISDIYTELSEKHNWYIAQSNPCFELWLYYHFTDQAPEFAGSNESKNWKDFLNNYKAGGFNSKKHPILIRTAISNAKEKCVLDENKQPFFLSTTVYVLGENIYEVIKEKIESARWRYAD